MTHPTKDRDLFHLYGILSHPTRKKIIEVIGEKGQVSFTDFKIILNLRVGTLYYHFDTLKGYVTQDINRKYVLTELGRKAYDLLHSKEYDETSLRAQERPPLPAPIQILAHIFLPTSLFNRLSSQPSSILLLSIIVIAFGTYATSQAGLQQLLLFYAAAADPLVTTFIKILVNITAIYGILAVSTILLYRRRTDNLPLLFGIILALLPLYLFPLTRALDAAYALNLPLFRNILYARLYQALLQGWTIVLLTAFMSQAKGLRLDRAVLPTLILAYLNVLIIYIFGLAP